MSIGRTPRRSAFEMSIGQAPRNSPCRDKRQPSTETDPSLDLWVLLPLFACEQRPSTEEAPLFQPSTQNSPPLQTNTHDKSDPPGELCVPTPNDELQTPLGAPVGPVHVAKVCSKVMSYLFTFDATKLPAAVACLHYHTEVDKLVV